MYRRAVTTPIGLSYPDRVSVYEEGEKIIVGADDTDIIACGRDDDDFRGGGFGDRPINSTLMAEIQEGRL